jgi:hypothetical protein
MKRTHRDQSLARVGRALSTIAADVAAGVRQAPRQFRAAALALTRPAAASPFLLPPPIPAGAFASPIAEWSREAADHAVLAPHAPKVADVAALMDRHEVLIGTPEAGRLA